ncbi:2-keto-3-deoxygluconate permease [Thiomonas sp. FB-6]|uniref:2-keto-3-deoxygluconate permease n=1 Tax=Thiomonas sp. FB-6 TaxID=1158291 RepID=UPI0018C9A528
MVRSTEARCAVSTFEPCRRSRACPCNSLSSSSGNSIANPAAVAALDLHGHPFVQQATVEIAASVVLTAILVPGGSAAGPILLRRSNLSDVALVRRRHRPTGQAARPS